MSDAIFDPKAPKQQSWQLAKFIRPTLTVYGRLIWVTSLPKVWSIKHDLTLEGIAIHGAQEKVGFATCVLGPGDNRPMVAYHEDIELMADGAWNVRSVPFIDWREMSNDEVQELAVLSS